MFLKSFMTGFMVTVPLSKQSLVGYFFFPAIYLATYWKMHDFPLPFRNSTLNVAF